jgi:putative flavoprotein involved in K+ transport
MTRLPGWRYQGADPDGFMHRDEVVDFFDRYAHSFGAPVRSGVDVERVSAIDGGFLVDTTSGAWFARNLVVATGATDRPAVPAIARDLAGGVEQLTPDRYRSPRSLPDGGVLVVGASATGVQLAAELADDGRRVVLAVGRHTRGVRRYRGHDIFRWLEVTGRNDTRKEELRDPAAAPFLPSLQVAGGRPSPAVDLPSLQQRGIELVGRLHGAAGTRVAFADDLALTTARADAQFTRLLDALDACSQACGMETVGEREPLQRVRVETPTTQLDLRDAGITSVVWATGYRRDYSWLDVAAVDRYGELIQRDGATTVPGLYVVGLRFQSRRNSNFIDGVGRDARAVVDQITTRAAGRFRVAV